MILIYACMIFATVTSDITAPEKEYTPNVGTVLFSAIDVDKKQWSESEVGLLQARKYFQNLLPPPIFINTFNEDHVKNLLAYFKDAYAAIKKEAQDAETDSIMTTALSDAIGGYFKVWILPVAKLDYYGGTISQANVVKLFQFYNEIKRYLDTDGEGWHKPKERTLNSVTINVAPLQLSNTRSMEDPCSHLAYFEKSPTGLGIPIPNVNWNDKLSTLFVPLKNVSLISMNTPNSSYNLIKYYEAARSCIQTTNPKEQATYDEKFQKWLIEEVVPHLKDENLYLALGSVLTLVNRTRDICNNILDLYVSKYHKGNSKNKLNLPCDVSNKKMWILIIILVVEIAWCVPALLFILCSKKLQQKDCSSNVYLFIDNEKKGKGDEKQFGDPKCLCLENHSGDLKVFRKSLFNTQDQCASFQQTNTMETGAVPCIKQGVSKAIPNCDCVATETKYPELCNTKRSSLKKPSEMPLEGRNSTQIGLSSHDTFVSRQSTKTCLTIRSKPCISSERNMLAKNKKKRDSDECSGYECKTTDDCHRKPNERRQSEECRKLEECRQAEQCRKLEELRKAEEYKKLEEYRKAAECRKLEEQKQAEECRQLERIRLAEEYMKHEERRQAKEYKRLEDRRQAEECKKLEERRQAEECRKLEEQRQAEECRKLEERRQAEECKKLEERRQAEERKKLEEQKQAEESRKLEERRQAEECKKLEERRQADECKKLEEQKKAEEFRKLKEQKQAENRKLKEPRQAGECRKLQERKQAEEFKKYYNYRIDERKKSADSRKSANSRNPAGSRKSADSRKYEKPDECRRYKNLEEKGKLNESREFEEPQILAPCTEVDESREVDEPREVNEYCDNVECHEISENRELEECVEFDLGPIARFGDSYTINKVTSDNLETGQENADDYDDYAEHDEPMSCRRVYSQEACPCTACVGKKSSLHNQTTASFVSNVTCCNLSLTDVNPLLYQQVETKSTRFQVTKEFKATGKGGSKPSPGKPYLEITIDEPGAGEVYVEMTQRRFYSHSRPSRIPKPATCSIQPYNSDRLSTSSSPDRPRSLIPQRKKKTTDDIDFRSCKYSKTESKLYGSF